MAKLITKTITLPFNLVLEIEKYAAKMDFKFSPACAELMRGALYFKKPEEVEKIQELKEVETKKLALKSELTQIEKKEAELKKKKEKEDNKEWWEDEEVKAKLEAKRRRTLFN